MTKLIVIEGPDRCGKATQTKLLAKYLRTCNKAVKVIEVPILGPLTYPLIYLMLKSGLVKYFPNFFQALQVINRLIFQKIFLPLHMKHYDYILFDRWALSSLIYGDCTGVNKAFNDFLFSLMIKPDVTVVINGPARNNESRDSYESDKALQASVNAGYALWCEKNPVSTILVGSSGTPDEVHRKIVSGLYDTFKKL